MESPFVYIQVPLDHIVAEHVKRAVKPNLKFMKCIYDARSGDVWIELLERPAIEKPKP